MKWFVKGSEDRTDNGSAMRKLARRGLTSATMGMAYIQ